MPPRFVVYNAQVMEKSGKNLGQKIKEMRKKIGMSQADLAEKAKTSTATINRIELGRFHPRYETMKEIAKALGVSEQELLAQDKGVDKNSLVVEILSLLLTLNEPQLRATLTFLSGFSSGTASGSSRRRVG